MLRSATTASAGLQKNIAAQFLGVIGIVAADAIDAMYGEAHGRIENRDRRRNGRRKNEIHLTFSYDRKKYTKKQFSSCINAAPNCFLTMTWHF
jgi:hypothetical protein